MHRQIGEKPARHRRDPEKSYSVELLHTMDGRLVVLLPVVLEPDREVLHGDALFADRPPAVPRDLYERVQGDLDLRGVSPFAKTTYEYSTRKVAWCDTTSRGSL